MDSYDSLDYAHGRFTENIPWHDEFVNFINSLGINALFIIHTGSNYFSLYVRSLNDVVKAKEILSQEGTEAKMVDKFFELAEQNGYQFKEHAVRSRWETAGHLNYIYSFEMSCMSATVRASKTAVTAALKSFLHHSPPTHVFCHSGSEGQAYPPGYVIIFEEEITAERIRKNNRAELAAFCREILIKHDKTGYWVKYEPQLFIDHRGSDQMYGYSRED